MKSVKRKSATSAFLRSRVIVAVRGAAAGRTRDPEASEGPTLVLLNASQPSSHSVNGNRAGTGMHAFRSSSSWCVMESAERRTATLLSLLKPGPGDILLDAASTERLLLGHHALTGDSHPLLSVAKRKKHLSSVSAETQAVRSQRSRVTFVLHPADARRSPPASLSSTELLQLLLRSETGPFVESAPVLSPDRKTIKEKNEPSI